MDAVAERLAERNFWLAGEAVKLGYTSLPQGARAGHFLALSHPGGLSRNLAEQLAKRHVHVSLRGEMLRVTPHLYNDDADCERLIAALGAAGA